jgi:serine kinase of HPr protein (carbohydrate metabolism regulator)
MTADTASVHASAVIAGNSAVLIRGAAGSGKSRLALALVGAAATGLLRFARLVGDDRVHIEPCHGRLIVRPAPSLAGLIEVRGVGIRRLDYEPAAVVGLVVDLGAKDTERLPQPGKTTIEGVILPHLAVAADPDPLHLVLVFLAVPATGIKCP